jgi:hypothetical protein
MRLGVRVAGIKGFLRLFWSTTEPNARQTIDAAPAVSYRTARVTLLKRHLLV